MERDRHGVHGSACQNDADRVDRIIHLHIPRVCHRHLLSVKTIIVCNQAASLKTNDA